MRSRRTATGSPVNDVGGRWLGGVDRQLPAILISPFVRQKLSAFLSSENHRDLLVLSDLMASGSLSSAMGTSFALAGCPSRHRTLQHRTRSRRGR